MSSKANEPTTPPSDWVERARTRADVLVLSALICVAVVVYYIAGRGMTFFYDEWSFILWRRDDSAAAFFSPHNGHLMVIPVLVYKALWSTVGLGHYGPYRLIGFALHITCVVLLFLFVRRRVGNAVAVVTAASLLFLGSAWQDLLWAFQIGFLGSIAAGLGALLLLERRDARGDVGAALLLATSLACSGLGVPFTAGATVYLLLERGSWRRIWLIAIPVIPYAVWYLHYGENTAAGSNLAASPWYMFESLGAVIGGIGGLGTPMGTALAHASVAIRNVLAGIALVLVALVIWKRKLWYQVAPFLVIPLAFWGLTALSRAQIGEPDASRYIYPGAVMVFLVIAEIARNLRFKPWLVGALIGLVSISSLLNLAILRHNANSLRNIDHTVAVELAAVEVVRAAVAQDFQPDLNFAPQIFAGPYLAAVDDYGSPALPLSRLASQSPALRLEFDRVLTTAIAPALVSHTPTQPGAKPVRVQGHENGSLRRHDGCLDFHPRSNGSRSSFDLIVPGLGLIIRNGAETEVRLRRLADEYPQAPTVALKNGSALLRPPPDVIPSPWYARIAPSADTTVCTAS